MPLEKKNILISSLGYAPGVVTGTVDAIKFFDGVDIHKVLTISTSDQQILDLAVEQILIPEFENGEFYPQGIEYANDYIEAPDIITSQHNRDFLSKLVNHMRENIQSDQIDGIYISLAGGRKTMSSLVMTAVKLIVDCFGNGDWERVEKFRELTHLILDDPEQEIESYGNVSDTNPDSLHQQSDERIRRKVLHPVAAFGNEATERVHLIPMSKVFMAADELQRKCQEWQRQPQLTPDPLQDYVNGMF